MCKSEQTEAKAALCSTNSSKRTGALLLFADWDGEYCKLGSGLGRTKVLVGSVIKNGL